MLKNEPASGLQIAFLIVAVLLLAAPADRYFFSRWQWATQLGIPVGRAMIFISAGFVLAAVPALRRQCAHLLAAPIQPKKWPELALVIALDFCVGMAAFSVLALWWWHHGGPRELASHMVDPGAAAEFERALSLGGVVTSLLLGGMLAPVVEELVFRGFLYRAWERQWGWLPAAIASSLVFGFLHPAVYISQFVGGLVFVGLYRRTGSLRASIVCHAVFNVTVWYPLLGRFVLPAGRDTGALGVWIPNFICLAIVIVAVPIYLWMSRDAALNRPVRA